MSRVMQLKNVIIVDDDADLLHSLGELLELECAVKCQLFNDFDDLQQIEDEIKNFRSVDTAILDINLGVGKKSGVEVYRWLRDHAFLGQIILMTGHAKNHDLVIQASSISNVHIFEKPLDLPRLFDLIKTGANEL